MSGKAPQTIADWLKEATRRLREADVESPDLSASLILSEATGFSRARLIGFSDEILSSEAEEAATRMFHRRLRHEPIAYLLGRKDFRNLTLEVSPSVLIPRPETEELIDLARTIAPAARTVVDAGTGSGCIPLSLTEVFPEATLFGADFSMEALRVAKRNDPGGRVNWVRSDWLSGFAESRFDLITSNPPYLTDEEMATLEPQVRDYEPFSALSGGADGCEDYRRLAPEIARCLKPGGWTVLEMGPSVAEGVLKILRDCGFERVRSHKDLAGRVRFASGRWIREN